MDNGGGGTKIAASSPLFNVASQLAPVANSYVALGLLFFVLLLAGRSNCICTAAAAVTAAATANDTANAASARTALPPLE